MGQIKLTASLIMIGLFTIAIITFATNFADDNDAEISIDQDTDISDLYGNLKENVSLFRAEADSTYESIIDTTIEPGSAGAPSTAPYATTNTEVIDVCKNVLLVGYTKIFGSGSGFGIFFTTIIAFISFMFALYLIRTWRGNPD